MNSHIYNLQERTECNKVEPKLSLWVINYEVIGRAKGTAVVKAKNAKEAADILSADSDFNACREDFKISRIEEILTTGAFSGLLMEEYVRKENSFTDSTVLIKLSDNTVSTEKIIDGAVTKDKISKELQSDINDVVNKISPGSITDKHIAKNAITEDHLQNNAVTKTKIAPDNIDSTHLEDGCIDSIHLSGECNKYLNTTINSVISNRNYGKSLLDNSNPVLLGVIGDYKIYQRIFETQSESVNLKLTNLDVNSEGFTSQKILSISGSYAYFDFEEKANSGIIDSTKFNIKSDGLYLDCSEFSSQFEKGGNVVFYIMMTYVQ